ATLATNVPRSEEIALDSHVLFYSLGISVLTGIVFGLIPALKTLRPDTHETLKEGGRGSSGARHRAQSVFIVVEMAMAVVLLIGAWQRESRFRSAQRSNIRDLLNFQFSCHCGSASCHVPRDLAATRERSRRGDRFHDGWFAPHDRRFRSSFLARRPAQARKR